MAVGYRRLAEPASDARIADLEQRLGRRTPDAYRDYLRRHDGGYLEDNSQAVSTVFGLGAELPGYASMWSRLDTYAGRVPEWLLPVANDAYGNLYCLSLRDTDHGSVWLWDHEEEADEDEPPTEDNLTRVAESWPGFLDSLQPIAE